jgi:hypothetical protein
VGIPQPQDDRLTARASAVAPWNDTPRKRWAVMVATVILILAFWAVYYAVAVVAGADERGRRAGSSDPGCEQTVYPDGRAPAGCP